MERFSYGFLFLAFLEAYDFTPEGSRMSGVATMFFTVLTNGIYCIRNSIVPALFCTS